MGRLQALLGRLEGPWGSLLVNLGAFWGPCWGAMGPDWAVSNLRGADLGRSGGPLPPSRGA
eukprot:4479404-Pyramimonas_sp.AAC.1